MQFFHIFSYQILNCTKFNYNESEKINVENIVESFTYNKEDLNLLYDNFDDCETVKYPEKMFLDTFIELDQVNSISDKKDLLVIDSGRTKLKIALYNNDLTLKFNIMAFLTENFIKGEEKNYFIWIANQVKNFFYSVGYKAEKLSAALVFPYPIKMTSIKSGTILNFCKDFDFKLNDKNVIDPVLQINNAFKNIKLSIKTKVLVNDATATLIAARDYDPNIYLGVVLGSGSNGALIDKNKLLNIEWGAFDHDKIRKTVYDDIIKNNLKNKSFANIDCMIGQRKLYEILRLIFPKDSPQNLCKEFYDYNITKNPDFLLKYRIIYAIKKRTFDILSVFIIKFYKNDGLFISINGSGFKNKLDQDMLGESIKKNLFLIRKIKINSIKIIFNEEASLYGAAITLLYKGKIPKKNELSV
ncbi:hypothetical protein GVAV_000922 [Gurleya vavrai]